MITSLTVRLNAPVLTSLVVTASEAVWLSAPVRAAASEVVRVSLAVRAKLQVLVAVSEVVIESLGRSDQADRSDNSVGGRDRVASGSRSVRVLIDRGRGPWALSEPVRAKAPARVGAARDCDCGH